MMSRLVRHLRSQLVAYIALFVALGGTGYAAINLPANSVGSRQLKRGAVGTDQLRNHSITPIKLGRAGIAGYIRAYAEISPFGAVLSSRPSATVQQWTTTGPDPGGIIAWKAFIPRSCFALATTTGQDGQGVYASASLSMAGSDNASTAVGLSPRPDNAGVPPTTNVALVCTQP